MECHSQAEQQPRSCRSLDNSLARPRPLLCVCSTTRRGLASFFPTRFPFLEVCKKINVNPTFSWSRLWNLISSLFEGFLTFLLQNSNVLKFSALLPNQLFFNVQCSFKEYLKEITTVHFFARSYGTIAHMPRLVGWLLFDTNGEWRREGPLKWTSQSAKVESTDQWENGARKAE